MTNDITVKTVTPLMSMECKGPEIPRTSHKPPSRGRARRCGLTLTVTACEAVFGGTVCLYVTWQSSTRPHHFRPAPRHSDTWHHQQGFIFSLQCIRPTYCLLPLLCLTKMNISYFSSDFVESTTICQALAPDNRLPYYLFKQFSLFADSCECSQLRL